MTRDLFDQMADESFADRSEQRDDEITLTLVVHGELDKSILVSETGDEKKTVKLPKSKVTVSATGRHTDRHGKPKYSICEITMPEWLAKDRGLV